MLILLPPSEGKATEGDGPALDLPGLTRPELTPVRRKVLHALLKLSRGRRQTAQDVLGLTDGQHDAIARNKLLKTAPTLRAADLYTGVLYDNLGLNGLDAAARAKIVVFSGLWGVLDAEDRVPPYRLAMGVNLPPLGPLAALWRPALTAALRPDGLVVDMRSAPYAASWKGPSVGVRVLREHVVGGVVKRSVVSHMAKATRGAVARDLLVNDVSAETPEELVKALCELGHTAELKNGTVEIVVAEGH